MRASSIVVVHLCGVFDCDCDDMKNVSNCDSSRDGTGDCDGAGDSESSQDGERRDKASWATRSRAALIGVAGWSMRLI
ncbi:hypothetical protein GQ44DRAFT_720517 [Phaeosphaeriaceae sp. PMI808]|nr:hypothetical protein GQ44DRAFT_720517 [Phaeosphaeriaceae sp. PMI808]